MTPRRISTLCSIAAVISQVFCGPFLFAEDEKGAALGLGAFVETACRKDTAFEEILIDELELAYTKALNLPASDFVLSLKGTYDYLIDYDEKDFENTASLSKLFPYTGTDISAEYNSSLSKRTRAITSDFSAQVSQPIAENAFGRNTRLHGKIIGLENDVAAYQIVEAYEDYLASLIQLYYDWYSAYENLVTGENSLKENEKLLENIKERRKSNIALPIDVNKIDVQVITKRENLLSLKNQYNTYLNLIRQAIRYSSRDALRPVDSPVYKNASIHFKDDYEKFKRESRTSKILALLQDKSSLEVQKSADELLPSIDVFGGYSLDGIDHGIIGNEQVMFAGAAIDWPFPGQVERAQYQTMKIREKKAGLTSENTHIKLYTTLKNLTNEIDTEKGLIATAKEKIDLAQSIVDDETENYSLGRATLKDLIDEINKLEENKFSKISHEVRLKKLMVEWLRLTDTLITKREIGLRK
ncbi:TolC family protein [Candidatus Omnitrophota bacterium]